jgi:hypothetical protein
MQPELSNPCLLNGVSGEFAHTQVGFSIKRIVKGSVVIKVWDLGGQPRFRMLWERYCRSVQVGVKFDTAMLPANWKGNCCLMCAHRRSAKHRSEVQSAGMHPVFYSIQSTAFINSAAANHTPTLLPVACRGVQAIVYVVDAASDAATLMVRESFWGYVNEASVQHILARTKQAATVCTN